MVLIVFIYVDYCIQTNPVYTRYRSCWFMQQCSNILSVTHLGRIMNHNIGEAPQKLCVGNELSGVEW